MMFYSLHYTNHYSEFRGTMSSKVYILLPNASFNFRQSRTTGAFVMTVYYVQTISLILVLTFLALLLLTSDNFVPSILSWKDLNVSKTNTILSSTSLEFWFSNR